MAMRLHGLEYRTSDGDALVEAVPTFGPFPEVSRTPCDPASSRRRP
ncbi:hypothetical protein [Streptomyces himalayensis]|nr:hypothetical protein [Streptomyces himalayensis]